MSDYYNFDKKDFRTEKETEAFIEEFNQKYNKMPMDDFCGLSPDNLDQLLHFPFESPGTVEFKQVLDSQPSAPIVTLFTGIIEAIGQEGVKCTAKGNLPRKAVIQITQAFVSEFGSAMFPPRNSIRSEIDFEDLYVARIIAQAAGLIRKYQGKFVLTKKCTALLAGDGLKAVYPMLLRACASRLAWHSRDGYPEIRLIQDSFAYSLFLLDKFGSKQRKASFYENAFLKAFPFVVEEVESNKYLSKEDVVRQVYSWRFVYRFAEFLGLVELDSKPLSLLFKDPNLKKTPLLASAVIFKVP